MILDLYQDSIDIEQRDGIGDNYLEVFMDDAPCLSYTTDCRHWCAMLMVKCCKCRELDGTKPTYSRSSTDLLGDEHKVMWLRLEESCPCFVKL